MEFYSLRTDYYCGNPCHFLPCGLCFDQTKNETILAHAYHFTDLGQPFTQAYAFIGIFGKYGSVNNFLQFLGIGRTQILFTDLSFILVASYISIPFMVLPIFNALNDLDDNLVNASRDLGASAFQTFTQVIWPLSLNGVRAGVQAVFIPSLSLFMLTRLIGGNKVITLGTAVEEHFLTTQNWGMGSTIAVVLVVAMLIVMRMTKEKRD